MTHLVHVSDGSKYGQKQNKKDCDYVLKKASTFDGVFDGASDKGAFFKFQSHSDAESFIKLVGKCPNKTCYADHSN